jgi:hypothetical protein
MRTLLLRQFVLTLSVLRPTQLLRPPSNAQPCRAVRREVLEVGKHRKRHLGSHVRNLDFAHHQPQVLHRSDTASAAISDKAGRFVLSFVEEKIDRVL